MKRSVIAISVFFLCMTPFICQADPPRPGLYMSGFAGVSVPMDTDVNASDASFADRTEFDPGFYVGGTSGFDFGYARLEGELSYRYSEIKSVTDVASDNQYGNVDGDIGVFAFMVNAFFDFHNATPVTPYFGGGIGFAVLNISDTFGTVQGASLLLYENDDETVFAYQAGAGLEIALSPWISMDLGYRYFGTSNASFKYGSTTKADMKFESHNAVAGIRVKF